MNTDLIALDIEAFQAYQKVKDSGTDKETEAKAKHEKIRKQFYDHLDTLSEKEVNSILGYLDDKYNYHNAIQNGQKLALNCFYGAYGNEFFVCSTPDIANAITAMGRDLIKFMDQINETYWYEIWPIDEDLHAKLGIDTDKIKPINSDWIHLASKTPYDGIPTQAEIDDGVYQRKVSVSAYSDTDSCFVTFDPGMKSCDWKGNPQDFIFMVAKERLEPLFKKKLETYAKKYKVENLQDFELENINESVLFLTKKKYIKHTVWEDKVIYPRLDNIVSKGVSLIQRGTPPFARDKVMEVIKYLFENHNSHTLKELLRFVKDLKAQFKLAMADSMDDLCKATGVNAYWSSKIMEEGNIIDGPGIIAHDGKYEYAKGTYFTVKAAGYYNYLLSTRPELQDKYEVIRPGMRIKYYYCKDKSINERFAYPVGEFPVEFAPEMDADEQFLDVITDAINVYMTALNYPPLNKRLGIVMNIF